MKRKNIFLIIMILILSMFPIFALINKQLEVFPIPERKLFDEKMKIYNKTSKEIEDYLQNERRMDKIIDKFGQPTYTLTKDSCPNVQYSNMGCNNGGLVLIWDKRSLYGKSYVLMISFMEKSWEWGSWGMSPL
jgi:hypothetical protein